MINEWYGILGKMTEITSMRPQTCEEISDIHIVPVGQAKKAGIIDKKKDLSQNGSVSYANAGLLVVTKRIPSDAYYKAKRNETGSMVSIGNERYRSNTESQMVSRGAYLRIIPCPAGSHVLSCSYFIYSSFLLCCCSSFLFFLLVFFTPFYTF